MPISNDDLLSQTLFKKGDPKKGGKSGVSTTSQTGQAMCQNKLYSITELIEEVGGKDTFWRDLIDSGRLPVVQILKKKILVDANDVNHLIESSKRSNLDKNDLN
ncbi:MAG: hypothetical protein HQK60_05490 [Deltaproteobacteria bacterium]|nr:hypothetical protein [Deltaproteobacteria bacterium]